jgi:uncharacterized protein (TIGR00255 family)
MAFSMTGYARTQSEGDDLSLVLTIRSVNHRFLDMQIRIPPQLEPHERLIRRSVKQHVKRGQLQISASVHWKQEAGAFTINRSSTDAYLKAYRELSEEYSIVAQPDLNAILRIPGVVSFDNAELGDERGALLEQTLTDCLERALEELNRTRRQEAEGIVEEMQQRGRSIQADLEKLEVVRQETVPKFRERLVQRLQDVLEKVDLDPQRLVQESAVLAERADISEEVQRLASHAGRFLELLGTGGELGKQIDFLAQEMNRETNTILSKTTPLGSAGLAVTEIGLRVRAEIEKIREQTQNLE